ncbi:MAG TPA: NlpC/P60 family protein [Caulobacteraceae bacterium]|jgi:cell wall-associated NlpC family hydrolase|nr:NlpC/P60 family protein [Caulobacteraceae bacterium]
MNLDPRLTPARGDLAAVELEGLVRAARYVAPTPMRLAAPAAPLLTSPDAGAELATELLFGEAFDVLDIAGGLAFGQALRDGYVGYVPADALIERPGEATHRILAPSTFALQRPSIRAAGFGPLSLNALVTVVEEAERFLRVEGAGWIPRPHLAPIGDAFATDAVAVAEALIGAPYRWGGRATSGLDCSGLVQQAMFAAGLACPRDSDQQAHLGEAVDPTALQRGDLVFWKGHVGLMGDGAELIHANAHHMAVAREPLSGATARIIEAGGGEPTGYRRVAELARLAAGR